MTQGMSEADLVEQRTIAEHVAMLREQYEAGERISDDNMRWLFERTEGGFWGRWLVRVQRDLRRHRAIILAMTHVVDHGETGITFQIPSARRSELYDLRRPRREDSDQTKRPDVPSRNLHEIEHEARMLFIGEEEWRAQPTPRLADLAKVRLNETRRRLAYLLGTTSRDVP